MKSEHEAVDQLATFRSVFSVPKMDCPSEENLIRMAVGDLPQLQALEFDLSQRTVTVRHGGDAKAILNRLKPLKLGAELVESRPGDVGDDDQRESSFAVPKMDCPSEENLIRMALSGMSNVQSLDFDLANRRLRITHSGQAEPVLDRLVPLNLGASLIASHVIEGKAKAPNKARSDDAAEARTLWLLLAINGTMFFGEFLWGWIAQSTGLIADSLDMFADAAVYGLALYAVGKASHMKVKAAHLAGWLQMALAVGALVEVGRRSVVGSEPEAASMMGVGLVALAANVICLVLIAKKRDRGAHMKASYIFSANDVLANLGVIIAGLLVRATGSSYPDLIIGTVIGLIVLNGARRILKLT